MTTTEMTTTNIMEEALVEERQFDTADAKLKTQVLRILDMINSDGTVDVERADEISSGRVQLTRRGRMTDELSWLDEFNWHQYFKGYY